MGKNIRVRLVFSPTLLSCSTVLPALQRNRAQSRLLYLLIKILSFTGIHKGVESPSDGISTDNNKEKSGVDLMKKGD